MKIKILFLIIATLLFAYSCKVDHYMPLEDYIINDQIDNDAAVSDISVFPYIKKNKASKIEISAFVSKSESGLVFFGKDKNDDICIGDAGTDCNIITIRNDEIIKLKEGLILLKKEQLKQRYKIGEIKSLHFNVNKSLRISVHGSSAASKFNTSLKYIEVWLNGDRYKLNYIKFLAYIERVAKVYLNTSSNEKSKEQNTGVEEEKTNEIEVDDSETNPKLAAINRAKENSKKETKYLDYNDVNVGDFVKVRTETDPQSINDTPEVIILYGQVLKLIPPKKIEVLYFDKEEVEKTITVKYKNIKKLE